MCGIIGSLVELLLQLQSVPACLLLLVVVMANAPQAQVASCTWPEPVERSVLGVTRTNSCLGVKYKLSCASRESSLRPLFVRMAICIAAYCVLWICCKFLWHGKVINCGSWLEHTPGEIIMPRTLIHKNSFYQVTFQSATHINLNIHNCIYMYMQYGND